MITYYYALQIYERLSADKAAKAHLDPVYMHPPDDITHRVLKLVKKDNLKDGAYGGLLSKLKQSHNELLDFAQVYKLKELGRGSLHTKTL